MSKFIGSREKYDNKKFYNVQKITKTEDLTPLKKNIDNEIFQFIVNFIDFEEEERYLVTIYKNPQNDEEDNKTNRA